MTAARLHAAVETSRRWYETIFALHGIPVQSDDRLWVALSEPPPWHSAVKTLSPDVDTGSVLAAMARHPHGSVADSFGTLDLSAHGFDLLVDATWVHHPGTADAAWSPAWSIVRDTELLADWSRRHDYAGVLLPAALADPGLHVLARVVDGVAMAGAVVHDADEVAGMSNLWASSDPLTPSTVIELLACVGALHPGRPVTDYAWGEELDALLAAGYSPVGSQRVWAR